MLFPNIFLIYREAYSMLEELSPKRVFHYFEKICSVPHGSGNTGKISEFCAAFAEERGLWYKKDSLNNIIIKKKASAGYEEHPPVILQGHMDMVCEKTPDCDIDFKKDGLRLRLEGDMLSADGTTLGADDGIAVAMILAVLEDDRLPHPPVTAVFTVDEEVGMDGAQALDVSSLGASTLINLDSGEEGVITAGCAGGAKSDISIPVNFEKNNIPCLKISLGGLLGGHSGVDINKGRQNACKLLAQLLCSIPEEFRLISFGGGFKDNVIPNACECVIACGNHAAVRDCAEKFAKESVLPSDPGLKIEVNALPAVETRLDVSSHNAVLGFLSEVKSGVIAMEPENPQFVKSSQNLGITNIENGCFNAVISVRSSAGAEKEEMLSALRTLAGKFGADFSTHGCYPAWEYRRNSRLRDVCVKAYKEQSGAEPAVKTIHAGLECGLFCEKIPDFDAVSIGPDMWDIHTVNERLSVLSTERTYNYLCKILKEL